MEAWRKNIFTTQNSVQQVQTSKPPLRKSGLRKSEELVTLCISSIYLVGPFREALSEKREEARG
jgi:hypothetical protein